MDRSLHYEGEGGGGEVGRGVPVCTSVESMGEKEEER